MRARALAAAAALAAACSAAPPPAGTGAGDIDLDIAAPGGWTATNLAAVTSIAVSASGGQLALTGSTYPLKRPMQAIERLVVHVKKAAPTVVLAVVASSGDHVLAVGTATVTVSNSRATPAMIQLGSRVADGFLPPDAKGVVSVRPGQVALFTGQTTTLQALGGGGWSVMEGAAGGTIDGNGVYTAPAMAGSYHAVAASGIFYQQSDAAAMTVTASGVLPLAGRPSGSGFNDGSGGDVRLQNPPPDGTTTDGKYIYFTDGGRGVVRRLDPASATVVSIAGSATATQAVESDGTGSAARLSYVNGVVYDGAANLYVAASDRIRQLAIATGAVTTLVGTKGSGFVDGPAATAQLSGANGLAWDGANALYVFQSDGCALRRVDLPSGTVTTVAGAPAGTTIGQGCGTFVAGTGTSARFCGNYNAVTYYKGTVLVVDSCQDGKPPAIRRFTVASGVVDTLTSSNQSFIFSLAAQGTTLWLFAGNLYTLDPATGTQTMVATFPDFVSQGVAVGSLVYGFGNSGVWVYDTLAKTVSGPLVGRRQTPDVPLGRAQSASTGLHNLALSPGGVLYAGAYDGLNAVRKLDPATGTLTRIAVALTAGGNCCDTLAADGTTIYTDLNGGIASAPDSGGSLTMLAAAPATTAPRNFVLDGNGNLYFSDGNTIRKLKLADNSVTTVAGSTMFAGGMDGTGAAAQFTAINGLAYDGAGTLYASDGAAIRSITVPAGVVTTIAGDFQFSNGACTDGVGKAARFVSPAGVTLDPTNKYLYISDTHCSAIRRLTLADGTVTTVVGTPGHAETRIGPLPGVIADPGELRFLPTGELVVNTIFDQALIQIRF